MCMVKNNNNYDYASLFVIWNFKKMRRSKKFKKKTSKADLKSMIYIQSVTKQNISMRVYVISQAPR